MIFHKSYKSEQVTTYEFVQISHLEQYVLIAMIMCGFIFLRKPWYFFQYSRMMYLL